jgi:FSR family fosmidomycin resistance protein-like MFS transporter
MTDSAITSARPIKVVGLVSMGHCLNHLFVMVVPPLAVTWVAVFGLDYVEVGVVLAAMSITSAIAVLPVGFLVDRIAARFVLVTGLTLLSLATIGFGLSQTYWHLLVCAVCAGLGNTVFHPCGYTILSATVPKAWLGRAFSVHTFSGYLGFALTPAIIGLSLLYGDWRDALLVLGLVGLAVAALMLINHNDLRDDRAEGEAVREKSDRNQIGFRLLMTLPILMCFLFFLFTTISFWGFDSFLPASLFEHHGIPEAQGTFALSVFFGFTALGILIGGVIADRTTRHGLVAVVGFSIAAVCILLVGEVQGGIWLIYGLIAAAGIGAGIVTPSRDLIVRKVTPAGQTGKVFAFMTVGMDAGSTVAPPVFGYIMDHGMVIWLYRLSALMLVFSIFTVTATRRIHGRMEVTHDT